MEDVTYNRAFRNFAEHPGAGTMLTIKLLGLPQILQGEEPLHSIRRKNRALLYYLAAQTDPLPRSHMLTFFWPDHDRAAAQQILRTMLHDLRKHLGAALVVEADLLALENVEVDARIFSSLITSSTPIHSLATTLDLYRGDFLKDFTLPDTPDFDDWVITQQAHYRSLAIRGLTMLSQWHESNHDYPSALETLDRALAFDPLQEDLQRACIRLHYLSGDRTGAIRRYDMLRRLLDEELGVPPMPETRSLYDAVITDSLPAPPIEPLPSPTPAQMPRTEDIAFLPFIGRIEELRFLREGLTPGTLILIEGEPGIGKTQLAKRLISATDILPPDYAQVLILWGSAHELEQGLPYQPIIDALRSLFSYPEWPWLKATFNLAPIWLAELSRLLPEMAAQFPDIRPPAADPNEARLWESLKEFILHLAHRRPVILVFDDLHWADAATIGFLGYLVRRIGSSPVFILSTARSAPADSTLTTLLQALQHENCLHRLLLPSLTTTDVDTLAKHFSPADSLMLSRWLMQHTEGNPYFLAQLIHYMLDNGLLHTDGSLNLQVLSWTPVLPPTIHNLILSRLMRLSPDARRVLEAAAVIGYEFRFEIVVLTLRGLEHELLDALDELRVAGLILPQGEETYVFDHSLTMEVIYQSMEVARYRFLHRQVAETLERRYREHLDDVAGVIAFHFSRGNDLARAVPYAYHAGREAAKLAAWSEAIAFYEQALSGTTDEQQRASIHMALGSARFHSGDFPGATETFRTALDLAATQKDLDLLESIHILLNQSLLPQARYAEAIDLGEKLRRTGPPELAACAEFIWGTGLGVESARPSEAEYHLREAERLLASRATSRVSLARIKYQLGGVMSQQGKNAEAVTLFKEALHLSKQDETALDLLRQIMVYNNLAYNLLLVGDPSAAEYARAGIQVAQEKGSLTHLPYLYSTSGEIALADNDLDAAEQFFREGLAIAEQVPIPERIAGLIANLGLVSLRRNQLDLARERLLDSLQRADSLGIRHMGVKIRLWLAPILPPTEAQTLLDEAQSIAENSGYDHFVEEINQRKRQILT